MTSRDEGRIVAEAILQLCGDRDIVGDFVKSVETELKKALPTIENFTARIEPDRDRMLLAFDITQGGDMYRGAIEVSDQMVRNPYPGLAVGIVRYMLHDLWVRRHSCNQS
jgi:hypothetical protein